MIWLQKQIYIVVLTQKNIFFEFLGSQEAKNAQKQLLKPYFEKLKNIHESWPFFLGWNSILDVNLTK